MATPTRATRKQKNGSSSLSTVLDGAEALVAATANMGEERLGDIRATLQADLEAAREQLEKLEAKLVERATGIDEYVHENPWQAIGVAAAAGVLVGAIAFRRLSLMPRAPLSQAIRDLLAAHRELSTLEWMEFRAAMVAAVIWIAAAALFCLAGWLALNAVIVVAFRAEPLKALAGVAGLNLSAAAIAAFRVTRLLQQPFFALTKRETARDVGTLLEVIS